MMWRTREPETLRYGATGPLLTLGKRFFLLRCIRSGKLLLIVITE